MSLGPQQCGPVLGAILQPLQSPQPVHRIERRPRRREAHSVHASTVINLSHDDEDGGQGEHRSWRDGGRLDALAWAAGGYDEAARAEMSLLAAIDACHGAGVGMVV